MILLRINVANAIEVREAISGQHQPKHHPMNINPNTHPASLGVVLTSMTLTVRPGDSRRKYCLIDGQETYRILRAYSLV